MSHFADYLRGFEEALRRRLHERGPETTAAQLGAFDALSGQRPDDEDRLRARLKRLGVGENADMPDEVA